MDFDYKQAIKRIHQEELKGNNPIPDILSFLHLKPLYEGKLFEILNTLFNDYASGTRNPDPLLRIDVPKPNFTIRPMSRPENKDWFLYEAIVDFIANQIMGNSELACKRSFSFLNFKQGTKGNNNWIKFDDKCREIYTSGYNHVVAADLTGYYENISLAELKKRIFNYLPDVDENNKIVGVLIKLLNTWSDERVSGYGLPQGPPASSFLADIYLDYVDRQMEKYKNYYRYMDDFKIFCQTEIEAKKALKDLIIALRMIKLNINAKKTRIISGKDIDKGLFDPLKPSLNVIEAILKGKNKEQINTIIPAALIKIFESSFLDDPFEKTHLNFSLYRLGVLQSSDIKIDTNKVITLIRDNFVAKPHHTGLFCFFLTLFPANKDIFDFLILFLQSEHNIYEWQEIKVLQSLLRFKVTPDSQQINFLIASAKDLNKHDATRAFYLLLVGKHGTNRDRDVIVDIYSNNLNLYIKTAIILAVQELGQPSRNDFYSRVKRNDNTSEIIKFIDYVKGLKSPLYYLDVEKPKLEGIEEGEPSPY